MTLPNFLIIGAPRCGTTTLYEELKRHPQIFMSPIKEPLFFAVEEEKEPFHGPNDNQGIRSLEDYSTLFSGARNEKAVGEASPLYLYSPKAPYRIERHVSDVKLIAILRNPVDRAYSHFLHDKLLGDENMNDFTEAIEMEEKREQMGWSPFWQYRKVGLYGEQLARYLSIFHREQIKIFLFEDLLLNPQRMFKDLFQFLGVDENFTVKAPSTRNVSGNPKNEKLHSFLTQPNLVSTILKPFLSEKTRSKLRLKVWDELVRGIRQRNITKLELDRQVREWLIEYYREDILRTQDILRRNLTHWLKAPMSQTVR